MEDVLVQLGMAHQKQVMDAVVQVQAGVETLTAKVDLGLQKKGGKKPEMIVAFLPCHDGDRFKNANGRFSLAFCAGCTRILAL